jgi:hypothetical protein
VAAVATRLVTEWNDDLAPVRNTLDLALENSEFRRINEVVRFLTRPKREVISAVLLAALNVCMILVARVIDAEDRDGAVVGVGDVHRP